ncbi:MAG: carboxypeptidase-like regulatory domain-containing protein, partial [Bacteroidota bacterium]|nr:carboxypeptidase-like regulatory domain-containing protein [Bacteroidota bacterium]
MPIRSWLTVSFLLFVSTLFAQTVRLSGKVTNERSEPVAGASIRISGTATGTTTNVEGVYFLALVPGTKYTLEISAVGYTAKNIADVDVTASGVN